MMMTTIILPRPFMIKLNNSMIKEFTSLFGEHAQDFKIWQCLKVAEIAQVNMKLTKQMIQFNLQLSQKIQSYGERWVIMLIILRRTISHITAIQMELVQKHLLTTQAWEISIEFFLQLSIRTAKSMFLQWRPITILSMGYNSILKSIYIHLSLMRTFNILNL